MYMREVTYCIALCNQGSIHALMSGQSQLTGVPEDVQKCWAFREGPPVLLPQDKQHFNQKCCFS